MDINQLTQMIKTPLTESDLIRLCDLNDSEFNEYQIKYKIPNREGIQHIADILERDVCNIYVASKGLTSLVYWDGAVFVEIMAYEENFIKQVKIKEMIDQQYAKIKQILKGSNAKLGSLLYLCNGNARYLIFKYLYNKIPDNQKYELFKNLYVSSEYGFQMFTEEFIKDVMKHKEPISLVKMIQNFPRAYNGKIAIYRGMCSKSTPAEKAWSWTTDFNTAVFFATRFGLTGKVLQGYVLINDVIDYINDRNEFEVLVNPQDVINIREIEFYDFAKIQDELDEAGVIDQYHNYVVNIDADSYDNPKGIHGVLHAKRVLLLALTIGYYEKLSEEDIEILAWAAIIHDIGRDHDLEDEEHGAASWGKAYENGIIPEHFNEEELNLLKYLVETHSQPDSTLTKYDMIKYNLNDELRTLVLYKVFKDADGLDRVRTHDLNSKYLRTDSATKMILLAHQFLKGIK